MSLITLRPSAEIDLEQIWDRSAKNWGDQQAERYLRDLWSAIGRIAEEPRRGRECNEIRQDYRKYQVASHVIFYRSTEVAVEIVRILHMRMDFMHHLQ